MTTKAFTAAFLVIAGGVSMAQAQTAPGNSPAASPAGPEMKQTDQEYLLGDMRQQPVYAADNLALGEIADFLIDRSGTIKAVIVDIGKGSNPKRVALTMSQLDIQKPKTVGAEPRSMKVVMRLSKDELARAPAFNAYDGK